MNERIANLALQTTGRIDTQNWVFTDTELENFVHRLIQDCCQQILENNAGREKGLKLVQSLKESFGLS